jgi:hypothetical protein
MQNGRSLRKKLRLEISLRGKRKGDSAMAYEIANGKPLTDMENEEYQQQELEQQQEVQERAEALALKLAQTYEELTRLLERNPGVKRQITEGSAKEDRVYQKLKQRLKLADMAPRCQWVKQGGTTCGSPQMKKHIYCFAHRQMAEARTLLLMLPAMEDANAIQMGLMRIQKALIEDSISTKKAGLLLYSMQLALQNVGQTTFGQAKDEEMVRETVDEEEAFSDQRSTVRQRQNQHQKQNERPFTAEGAEDTKKIGTSVHRDIGSSEHPNQDPFTAEGAGDAEEVQGLPRTNTDDTHFGKADEEFVSMPGGYGFQRVRLRIEPGLAGQGRPVQAAVVADGKSAPPKAGAPHEHPEVHANLG